MGLRPTCVSFVEAYGRFQVAAPGQAGGGTPKSLLKANLLLSSGAPLESLGLRRPTKKWVRLGGSEYLQKAKKNLE